MIRRIIEIDEEKCTGCGLCASACQEEAIVIVNGKAKLLRDDYCDGLGNCLPACPTGAIAFIQREAAPYDEEAVENNKKKKAPPQPVFHGCPGSQARSILQPRIQPTPATAYQPVNRLAQWPVQIQLLPIRAPYFQGADLLIAADCTAYAFAGFHESFMKDRVTIIGCPKLDPVDYTDKLTEIIRRNTIQSITVVRMIVPCCGGLEYAARNALQLSGKEIPFRVVVISTDGRIVY